MRFALGVIVGVFVGRPIMNTVGQKVVPPLIDKVLDVAENFAEKYGYVVIQKEDDK